MRTFLLTLVVSALFSASIGAAELSQVPQVKRFGDRRCAYLGRWGSFHIIGDSGSAAYYLHNNRYVADLSFAMDDGRYWVFRPTNGDPQTTYWAFARQRDRCGRYWVWRYSHGRWIPYEATKAWGEGLDLKGAGQIASQDEIQRLNNRVNDLEDRVNRLESKQSPTLP